MMQRKQLEIRSKAMQAETRKIRLTDSILAEMDQEAEITNRLFNVIPEDKLGWRPHPKAKTLGALAMHIATIPASVAELGDLDVKELGDFPADIEPSSRAQIVDAFAESLKRGKEIVAATDDARAVAEWKLVKDGQTVFAAPRMGFWRTVLLNHNYHHRGQLSALRELDIPLPSIYGASADTNPFA
jgi:uncharacterized damage-inducible protein DinB